MTQDDHSKVIDALGGKKGIIDTGLPGLVFLLAYNFGHHLPIAIAAALTSSAILTVVSILRKDSLQFVASGFIGVAFCAFLSWKTGDAKNYYLPSLWKNSGFALVYMVANLAGWPILGVILGPILGENLEWRKVSARKRVYIKASWLWCGMFAFRLAVQFPLYMSDNFNALGIANVFLGLPLYFLTLWGTWLLIKSVPTVKLTQPE